VRHIKRFLDHRLVSTLGANRRRSGGLTDQ
jgi:hypothetical protein